MANFDYISKPVVVQAFKLSALESDNTQAFPRWLIGGITSGVISLQANVCQTKQGLVNFNPQTDWLIRLDDGEIYPCSDEVFQKKYEPAASAGND